ncbi:putative copper transporter crmD [Penicillium oxalicum]|uniref:Copper transport protein n=1 Tax=Penicillium oxalicum (strain 114-2 / CGMCC 5302) TaxID=933388 RepID=S8AXQ4_PENO1|nr:putative copper transporter crmD [Penicillium oxalicum]EPS31138.1 hypothetical protein PDE_06093 [Penicillium oxalicum 114-2]KAI2785679.1 putative copper transporter crmD [Penicillium oxalicum]
MDHVKGMMDHSERAKHGTGDTGNGTYMAMPMVFTFSTKVTILFSWWSTSTVVSYVISLFFLILLALFNRFLGILKLQLDRTPTHSHYKPSDVPKLSLPPSRWTQNQSSKDRGSPLPPQLEVNHDTDGHAAFPSTPSLGPTPHLYSDQREQESHGVDSHPRFDHSLRPHRKWNWSQDIIGSMLEGVRALTGYALMLAVMTYNVGILCAVIMGIVIGEVFLGRFSIPTPSSRWQDRACHDG